MAKRRKLTETEKQYRKQRRRIKQFVEAAEKRGYRFNAENPIPTIPKSITPKDVERLNQIRPDTLYKSAIYLNPETGRYVTGEQGRIIERKLRKKTDRISVPFNIDTEQPMPGIRPPRAPKSRAKIPANISTNIIETVREMADKWVPDIRWSEKFKRIKEDDKLTALNILNGAIERDGYEATAARLEAQADKILTLFSYIIYGASGDKKDGIAPEKNEFNRIVNGGALTQSEADRVSNIDTTYYDEENYDEEI